MVLSDSLGEVFTQVCITQEPSLWSKVFLLIDSPGLYGYSSLCVESCHRSQVRMSTVNGSSLIEPQGEIPTHTHHTSHTTHTGLIAGLWICPFTCCFWASEFQSKHFINRFNSEWHQLTAEIFLCCNSSHVLCIQQKQL